MDKKHFDSMRNQAAGVADLNVQDLFVSVIDTLEKIWNRLTSSPVDITKHDDHGRVKMED